MSKDHKNYKMKSKGEKDRALKALASKYSEENSLDDVSAPSVDVESGIIKNEKTLDQILFEINSICERFQNNFNGDDFNIKTMGTELRVLKVACQVAIAKIETNW